MMKIRYFLPYGIVRYSERKQKKIIFDYCKKYANKYSSELNETFEPTRIVWVCWLQGEKNMPPLCKSCYESIKQFCSMYDYKIAFVSMDNYSDYVDVDPAILLKHKNKIISNAHFSDILRLELLIKYGGIWVDPTVLFTSPIPKEILQSQLFVFKGSSFESAKNKDIGPNISNWFIVSQKGNNYLLCLKEMLVDYWKHNNKAFSYYIFHIFFSCIGQIQKKWWDSILYYPNILPHYVFFFLLDKEYNKKEFEKAKHYCFCQKLTYKYGTIAGTLKSAIEEGDYE